MGTNTSDGTSIILFPQYAELKNEVEKLRTELSMLVGERDALKLVECKNIETAYLLAVGHLEYQAYEIECAIYRIKRKIELIQAKKNRQEKIVLVEIEKVLDGEFAEYQKKLDEQIEKMNEALARSQCKVLSDQEEAALKKKYRAIVKALHPDLNPAVTDAEAALFYHAVQAYENGDLETISMIAAMVSGMEPVKDNDDGVKMLIREKQRLTELLQSVKDSIEEIKRTYPYILKPMVLDKNKMAERKDELLEIIDVLNDALAFYQEKAKDMLR